LDCFGQTLLHHVLDGRVDPFFNITREESFDSDSLDEPDILGRSPLHIACHKGTDSQVEALLGLGADIGRRTFHGSLPLHYAAASGGVAVCQILRDTPGINANAVDNYGNTALVYAVKRKAKGVIQLLLSFPGIDQTAIDQYGNSILIYAIEKEDLDVIELLLTIPGIDINAVDKQGKTALLYAVQNKNIEVFKFLLEHWTIVPDSPIGLRQPLIEATAQGNELMVQSLLAAGANPDLKYNGRTALYHAVYNKDMTVMNLLGTIKQEILLNSYELGQTALAMAATIGFLQGMKYLMDQEGMDVNSRDDLGRTPLIWAAKYGHLSAVELLLQQSGVDLSIADHNGNTATHHALKEKHRPIAEIIEQEILRRTKNHKSKITAVNDTPWNCLNCGYSMNPVCHCNAASVWLDLMMTKW
jgi:ankyrin repeat protein